MVQKIGALNKKSYFSSKILISEYGENWKSNMTSQFVVITAIREHFDVILSMFHLRLNVQVHKIFGSEIVTRLT